MPQPKCPESEFLNLFTKYGPTRTAQILGLSERSVYSRRAKLEAILGIEIIANSSPAQVINIPEHPQRANYELDSGVILVASDAHYWPGVVSTAHRAFVKAIEMMQPKIVVMNGDAFDGSSISRHPPIGWESSPSVIQELEACKERLGEIQAAAKNAKLVWTLGNHDARFETKLATVASEFREVTGVHLQDHFPEWCPAWSCWVNNDVVIKHRYKGGVHATHNNTLTAGKTMVTGHLHSLKVTPYDDYNGYRFGVDTGTLADPYGPQFRDYTEDNPRNHRSGFAVLTFERGELRWPEIVHVVRDGVVEFRGKTWDV